MLKALASRVSELTLELKDDFLTTLDVGDSKSATLDDGTRLGKVSKAAGRLSPVVTNEQALLSWVEKNYPEEVRHEVREAFATKLLNAAKKYGEPIDPATGEIVPGIGFAEGSPYITFRGEPGYTHVVAERWQEIAGPALLERA